MIRIICTCGCGWHDSEWKKIDNFFSPNLLVKNIDDALLHITHLKELKERTEKVERIVQQMYDDQYEIPQVEYKYDIDESTTKRANITFGLIQSDGYHDIDFDDVELFYCKLGSQCDFPLCKSIRDHKIGRVGMPSEDALWHHTFYVHKKRAEILAGALHTRLGSDSPLGMIDAFTHKQIISLIK